jgi:hypothetical protein
MPILFAVLDLAGLPARCSEASYSFDQGTDYEGRPNTTVHVGLLTVVLTGEVAASPVWDALMFDPYRRESGHLVFFQGKGQTFKRLTFYDAACVFYECRFDARGREGQGSFETELRFSAATLDVQGQRTDAHSIIPWPTDAATSRRALTEPPEPSLGLPTPMTEPLPSLPPSALPPVSPATPPVDAHAAAWKKACDEVLGTAKVNALYEAYKKKKTNPRKQDAWWNGTNNKGGAKRTVEGRLGEYQADKLFKAAHGYEKLNHDGKLIDLEDPPKGKGIDGVWEKAGPPPEYFITETKYNSVKEDGSPKDLTKGQMSNNWVRKNLGRAVSEDKVTLIEEAMDSGRVKKRGGGLKRGFSV